MFHRIGLALLFAAALGGCQRQEPVASEAPPAQPAAAETPAPADDGSGIAIVSPAAGGMSPVYGSESLQGGGSGGGVGNAAKDAARDVAKQPTSSLESAGGLDGE